MNTKYTIAAILATLLFSQNATAKLGSERSTKPFENNMEINVEAEIINNINEMLANLKAPSIKIDTTKQLDIDTVQSQTNELVQGVTENLPRFKFKVVITE